MNRLTRLRLVVVVAAGLFLSAGCSSTSSSGRTGLFSRCRGNSTVIDSGMSYSVAPISSGGGSCCGETMSGGPMLAPSNGGYAIPSPTMPIGPVTPAMPRIQEGGEQKPWNPDPKLNSRTTSPPLPIRVGNEVRTVRDS